MLRYSTGMYQSQNSKRSCLPIWSLKTSFCQKIYDLSLERDLYTGFKTGFTAQGKMESLSEFGLGASVLLFTNL